MARTDVPAPPAPPGLTAAIPDGSFGAPVEQLSPRAELVPPGDSVRGRNVDLPLVPAALVALALPALAAVLASLF